MGIQPHLRPILDNDGLTRGLTDPEARILVEWLVDQAERLAEVAANLESCCAEVLRLCRKARCVARFVNLWCHARERGAAVQLAAAERVSWPFPDSEIDPCELMHTILACEGSSFAA